MVFGALRVQGWITQHVSRRLKNVHRRATHGRCFCAEPDGHGSRRHIITYLTDVEGDAAYLNRYVENSKVLTFRQVEPRLDSSGCEFFPYRKCIDFTSDDSILVYGGDVWDRGGSDLYVIRQLLDLRRRHGPERVYFLFGNRDLNKMRILQEIGLNDNEPLPKHGGVYFLRGTGRQGDPDYCEKFLSGDDSSLQSSLMVPSQTAAERLKWMLSQTMGSPDAFESRRLELESEQRLSSTGNGSEAENIMVTDEDVVQSYRNSCHPSHGEMGRYLSKANLVLRLGNVLFMHGALPLTQNVLDKVIAKCGGSPPNEEDAMRLWTDFDFAMPWRRHDDEVRSNVSTVDEWFNELNDFARRHIGAWKHDIAEKETSKGLDKGHSDFAASDAWITYGGYHQSATRQPYGDLLQYGMGWTPGGKRNPTVVYSSWFDNGNPTCYRPDVENIEYLTFASLVRSFFKVSGFQLCVSGHQPHGDVPMAIRVIDEASSCWIMCCDTSYSGDLKWIDSGKKKRTNPGRGSGTSGRGDLAVSEVLIEQCVRSGKVIGVKCHGVLSDGSSYETVNLMEGTDFVGQPVSPSLSKKISASGDNYWVKAKMKDGSYLVTRGEGFEVFNLIVND